MRRPTRDDVARYARVSGSTVSRVLSGRTDVPIDDHTRARVLEAAAELGYHANHAARSLASGRTSTIGLLTIDSFTAFYGAIASRLTECAEESGYTLAVHHVRSYEARSGEGAHTLQSQVDGLIACDLDGGLQRRLAALFRNDMPIVNMGIYGCDEGDCVVIDLLTGAFAAVGHLVDRGYRRIAYMLWQGSHQMDEPRNRAYEEVLRVAGLPTEFIYVEGVSRRDARRTIGEYIRERGRPEAIFCRNDDMAIGCYRGLLDIGLRVPEDVALVGCDGIEDTEYLECPLTTIMQPIDEMCSVVWSFLENRLNNRVGPHQQAVLSPDLVIRRSTWRER